MNTKKGFFFHSNFVLCFNLTLAPFFNQLSMKPKSVPLLILVNMADFIFG